MDFKMTRMKFQVESKSHSEDIQKALFRRGISWADKPKGTDGYSIQHTGAPYLYVDEDRKIRHGHSRDVFDEDMAQEYVYRLALVEPREPGQPLQSVPMPVFHVQAQRLVVGGDLSDVTRIDCRTVSIENDVLKPPRRTPPVQKPPLGPKPRWHEDKLHHISRGLDLAGAINRYTNAQLPVPVEWVTEYNERVEEIRKLENV